MVRGQRYAPVAEVLGPQQRALTDGLVELPPLPVRTGEPHAQRVVVLGECRQRRAERVGVHVLAELDDQ
jgi:hypothetical protein